MTEVFGNYCENARKKTLYGTKNERIQQEKQNTEAKVGGDGARK